MPLWLIPMIYVAASAICGVLLPRLENVYLASYTLNVSVASAQAYLSATASGMMALTGIVFSPLLLLWCNSVPLPTRLG